MRPAFINEGVIERFTCVISVGLNYALAVCVYLLDHKNNCNSIPAITMTKEQGRILGIISIVLSTLTLTYAALWFAGLV